MLRRQPDVVYERVDSTSLLLSADGQEILTLNAMGTFIWEQLGDRTEADLAGAVASKFPDVDAQQIHADVSAFLDQLVALELVEGDRADR